MSNELLATFSKFLSLMGELTFLFILINFLVNLLQQHLSEEKIQQILGSQNGNGYFTAALLGSMTPFCTCSTIPILKGLIKAKAGFGPTMVFLFTSPLLNPMIIIIFATMFGLKITIFYMTLALGYSLSASIILSKLNFDKYLIIENNSNSCSCTSQSANKTPSSDFMLALNNSWKEFLSILPYLIISALIGAIIYGYIPNDFISRYINQDNKFAIPVAAVIGIPLYVRASILIPLASVLVAKGVSLGAMLALIIGGSGASLPELIMLKSLFRLPLLLTFIFIILSMAIFGGYAIQIILPLLS